MSFPGIVLRISVPEGPLLEADSYQLHLASKIAAIAAGAGEWNELLRTTDGLVIEARAVTLSEVHDDEDEDDE